MDLTAWMKQWNMLPERGGTVLCAVSGGRDSVCLLHYLHGISAAFGFSLAAGHYNHHMRPTAQRDEDFVRELCDELQIPFYTDGADVCRVAQERGEGVEETGRRLRYAFLERLADDIGADRIATAHHMNDQAETVLLNLLRGTGPEGLSGIPPVRGRLIRPLLNTPRQEIEDYLEQHGLGHVEDETNDSLRFSRNRLRCTVLPELEKINPALRQNIARTAAIIRQEDQYLDRLAQQYLPETGTQVACSGLLAAPPPLQPRMLRVLVERLGVGKKDFTAAHLEAMLALARRGRDGMMYLPGGACAVCRDGIVCLTLSSPLPPAMELVMGQNSWGEWEIIVGKKNPAAPRREDALYLDREKVGDSLQVDVWRGGEGLYLPGSRGSRSIKRLLTERGVSAPQRGSTPCIRVSGVAAAVYGLGTDQQFLSEDGEKMEIILYKKGNI